MNERSRRDFLQRSLQQSVAAAGVLAGISGVAASAPPGGPVLVNHVGFVPSGAKFLVTEGAEAVEFSIVDRDSGRTEFGGVARPMNGDLGQSVVGDFSALTRPGRYEARLGAGRSGPFAIATDIYTSAIRNCVGYFAKQRCGDSRTGHHAPCHLDDGRRQDDGRQQDVTGGWHDACDLRKWVNATIYGMIGLSRVLESTVLSRADGGRIIDELRWGNAYFLKMQDPAGYVMDYCGGDDGNNYTDNRRGTADDRVIHNGDCELPAQFHFIAAQAAMARHTRPADPAYASGCEASARRCLDWCVKHRSPGAARSLAAAVIACVELHRTVGGNELRDLAAGYAKRLLSLQETAAVSDDAPVRGFFRSAVDRPEPSREIMHGNLPMIALCQAVEYFGDHADVGSWRRGLELHAEYLLAMTGRSAFGTVPFGLYSGEDPGGSRRIGRCWYRWFMKPRGEYSAADWWVGINAHLASNGLGLAMAGRLLRDWRLSELAQRQLDWIIGVNPFDASTMTGAGRNHAPLFVTGEFRPATPPIDGGVMNGIGGSPEDAPQLYAGSYHTCEYWTPMVGYTMWLMAELQRPHS